MKPYRVHVSAKQSHYETIKTFPRLPTTRCLSSRHIQSTHLCTAEDNLLDQIYTDSQELFLYQRQGCDITAWV